MKNLNLVFFFSLLFLIFFPKAPALANVIINEIAWMGTENSSFDEWIELYNKSQKSINLKGWLLKAEDGKLKIELSGKIKAYSFYLLERTDDSTLPDILADQIYKGALSNKGENLRLYDKKGNLIDEVLAINGWPAGENDSKRTMERKNDNDWQTSKDPGGTPKAKNSSGRKENLSFVQKEEKLILPAKIIGETQTSPFFGFLSMFLQVFVFALFFGLLIIFLKNKLKVKKE
jgi:hypothetical protein